MNKFKVGDKVLVNKTRSDLVKGDEATISRTDGDRFPRMKLTKTRSEKFCVGHYVVGCDDDLDYCTSSDKKENTQPKCYAEIKEDIQLELSKKNEEILNILCPESDHGVYSYSEGSFDINSEFTLEGAIELKKWLTKMTAVPKPVKKVKKSVKKGK